MLCLVVEGAELAWELYAVDWLVFFNDDWVATTTNDDWSDGVCHARAPRKTCRARQRQSAARRHARSTLHTQIHKHMHTHTQRYVVDICTHTHSETKKHRVPHSQQLTSDDAKAKQKPAVCLLRFVTGWRSFANGEYTIRIYYVLNFEYNIENNNIWTRNSITQPNNKPGGNPLFNSPPPPHRTVSSAKLKRAGGRKVRRLIWYLISFKWQWYPFWRSFPLTGSN